MSGIMHLIGSPFLKLIYLLFKDRYLDFRQALSPLLTQIHTPYSIFFSMYYPGGVTAVDLGTNIMA